MLSIKFEGHSHKENNDFMMPVSKGVCCDLTNRSDDMGKTFVTIDILASKCKDDCDSEFINPVKIGELAAWAYGTNHLDLALDGDDFEDFQLSDAFYYKADEDSDDTAFYYSVLEYFYDDIKLDNDIAVDIFDEMHVLFLHRFFIEPEYRSMGIGNFIAQNLSKIFYSIANLKPIYCVGILNPDDKTEETKQIQIRTMENANFEVGEIDGSTVFAGCIYDEDIM